MKSNYEDWIRKADRDLKAVSVLLAENEILADVCCFHCQQAVEKYLKAYLVHKNIFFEKTHNLAILLSLCTKVSPDFQTISSEVQLLNEYAISPRYPDEGDDLTNDDALKAFELAKQINKFITDHFFRT